MASSFLTGGISREDFRQLAEEHQIIPVWQSFVADMSTPVAAFNKIVGEGSGFLLESVEDNQRWSRFSFIGRNPLGRITARGSKIEISAEPESSGTGAEKAFSSLPQNEGILSAVEGLFRSYKAPVFPQDFPIRNLPFWGGVAGYMGYDIVREIEDISNVPEDDRSLPDAIMEIIGELVVFDHWKQQVTLIKNILIPEGASQKEADQAYDEGLDCLNELSLAGTLPQEEPLFEPPSLNPDFPDTQRILEAKAYESAVKAAKEYIRAGDILQVVLSERFDFDLDASPFDVYRVLRQINPSPYMFFLRYSDFTILGSSPESLVQVRNNKITVRPIAGTRRRGETQMEDKRLEAELMEDPKEKAEHIMLVDLARNDLGKVVEYESLKVDKLMELEKFSHVIHMTSEVSGQLRPCTSPVEVLRAAFPAGTVSGAPKIRAMEIIDELETVKRGPYAGMVGYLDFQNNLDSAIAIRTMVVKGNRAWVQAGAGIVADSDPAAEEQECQSKAGALLAAVSSARNMGKARKDYAEKSRKGTNG